MRRLGRHPTSYGLLGLGRYFRIHCTISGGSQAIAIFCNKQPLRAPPTALPTHTPLSPSTLCTHHFFSKRLFSRSMTASTLASASESHPPRMNRIPRASSMRASPIRVPRPRHRSNARASHLDVGEFLLILHFEQRVPRRGLEQKQHRRRLARTGGGGDATECVHRRRGATDRPLFLSPN